MEDRKEQFESFLVWLQEKYSIRELLKMIEPEQQMHLYLEFMMAEPNFLSE